MKKLFLFPLLIFSIASCNFLPDKTVNAGVDTLSEAIRKLETNSESWQVVLEETRDTLIQEGQSTLANEVSKAK